MEKRKSAVIRKILYISIFIVISIPLVCEYVMEGGEILLWLVRIEELETDLRDGILQFFPSTELMVTYNSQNFISNSNLWLVFPASIRLMGGSITLSYRLYMLFLNTITILSAKKMFEEIFSNKNTALIGVLLFMTAPYRVYIAYDKASLGVLAAWAVIPLFLWGLFRIIKGKRDYKTFLITAFAFAGIAYADVILALLVVGIVILAICVYRKFSIFPPMLVGSILFIPGIVYLTKYLQKGIAEVGGWPLEVTSSKGYAFAQFFSSWVYRADFPGFGLGIMLSVFMLGWLAFLDGKLMIVKKYGFFLIILIIFSIMSTTYFPLDIVQSNVFFGFAGFAASVLGSYGVECVIKQEKLFVKIGMPLIIVISTLAIYIYMCNTLTYYREPMFLLESL